MERIMRTIVVLALQAVVLFGTARADPHTGYYPRPIPMGVSISTTSSAPYLFAGTAGMRVRSLVLPNVKFILSNNHVMGAVGPTLCPDTAPQYTWILQPGTLDIGYDPGQDIQYVAGVLSKAVPIDFSAGAGNLVDAAIALTSPNLAGTEILEIGNPTSQLEFAAPGMPLIKSGRTTGVTTGTVLSVNATVRVNYGAECGTARFVGQVITSGNLGSAGDSGSVVLNSSTLAPVGLYFAGSPFFGIMNQIYWVYVKLGVFVDGSTPPSFSDRQQLGRSRVPAMDERISMLESVQARHEAGIMGIPGVVGMGIGLAENARDLALIVYCEKKSPEMERRVPKSVEGVPVRLIESGRFEAH